MGRNPFEVTKAVDFTDGEILDTFVDYPEGSFRSIVDPASPMPQFLISGKGGGRTHLMRYYSYAVQRQRARDASADVLTELSAAGYLGIYMRCSGLNGSRFSGKGIDDDAWRTVFSYYMDAWIVEHLLNVLIDIQNSGANWPSAAVSAFFDRVVELVPTQVSPGDDGEINQIEQLIVAVRALRRTMDRAVNNASFSRTINIEFDTAPGELVFGFSKAASEELPGMVDLRFTFMIDEYENLSIEQQKYVNTLIREKELPTSFLIGSRIPGVRTHLTLSADEENRKGSEYELVVLEDAYRRKPERYEEFCTQLALRRLKRSGNSTIADFDELAAALRPSDESQYQETSLLTLLSRFEPKERPYLIRLRSVVVAVTEDEQLADAVVDALHDEENPLIERLRMHRFYQSWRHSGGPTLQGASDAAAFLDLGAGLNKESRNFVGLWKSDMLAQIHVDAGEKTPYLGLDQLVLTSGYLPRNFLILLKSIARWADFYGQEPFAGDEAIGPKAQIAGVLDACEWFSIDALPSGVLGSQCDVAMRRIGSLLQRARYSDKPVEVGFAAFSTSTSGLSEAGSRVLEACVAHELIVEIAAGRSDRNLGSKLRKFQIHPMLAPIYGLPNTRRGEMKLNKEGTYVVFDPEAPDADYGRYVRARLAPMRPPFVARDSAAEATLFDE